MSSAVLVCNLERNEGGGGQIQMKNISMGVDPGGQVPRKECNGRDTNVDVVPKVAACYVHL